MTFHEFGRPNVRVFLILFLVSAFLFYSLVIEPNSLNITENSFDLFEGSDPVRIVLISDIHAVFEPPGHLDRVVEEINRLEPDLVLIAGDVIEGSESELELLEPLSGIEANTYAVLGNHDYGSWGCPVDDLVADAVEEKLESMGIAVLRNEHVILESGDKEFALIGVDDQWVCRNDYAAASAGISDDIPKVVLTHNELAVDAEEIRGKSVVLSGHTHCGQVNVPFFTRFFLGSGFGDVVGGRTSLDEDTEIYVTCGILQGGIRFLAPPEISLIELR